MEHVIIISVDFIVDVQEDILVGLNEEMFFFNEYRGFSLQVVIVKILHLNVNVFNK